MAEQGELFFVYNRPPEDRIPNKDLLRVDEAANCLSCTREHVYNLIQEGELDASNIARSTNSRPVYRITSASVKRFLKDRREGAH